MSSFTVLYHLGGLIQGEKVIEPVEMTLKLANYGSNGGVRQAHPPVYKHLECSLPVQTSCLYVKTNDFFYNAEALTSQFCYLAMPEHCEVAKLEAEVKKLKVEDQ